MDKIEKIPEDSRLKLFQVEELEQRFEMKPWVDMNLVVNVGCPVEFPDQGSVNYDYYRQQ